jgi:hypothetical protein
MFPCPIEQDSILERHLQERMERDSFDCKVYNSLWRLEENELYLEQIEKDNQVVDVRGVFDAYREKGRIVARWFSGELLVVHGEGFSYAFDFYTLTDPPHSHRYETEIRYTLRQGTVVNRKETRNSLRKQENRQCNYTINMLFDHNGVALKDREWLFVEILPYPDGTLNRLKVKLYREELSQDHPYTREATICAGLMDGWQVVTLNGEIQPVGIDIRLVNQTEENDRWVSRKCSDSLEMKGEVYRMDAFPLQYNSEAFGRVRAYLKGAFTTENPRGYWARWKIVDNRLWLTEIRNARTGERIPLSMLVPGNDGTPVEASWYTGTFEIAAGENLDFPWHDLESREVNRYEGYNGSIERREIVCEVKQGQIIHRSVYDNYIQPGDTTAYKRCVHVIRSHDWCAYPELEDRTLCGGFTVYPRVDGTVDSITDYRLHVIGKYPPYSISDLADPRIELIRRAAEAIPRWEVRFFRGKVEPLKITFFVKKREGGSL